MRTTQLQVHRQTTLQQHAKLLYHQTKSQLQGTVRHFDRLTPQVNQRQNNLDNKSKVADTLKNQPTQKREAHLANDQELSQLTSTLKNPSRKIPRTQLNIQQARLLVEKPQ